MRNGNWLKTRSADAWQQPAWLALCWLLGQWPSASNLYAQWDWKTALLNVSADRSAVPTFAYNKYDVKLAIKIEKNASIAEWWLIITQPSTTDKFVRCWQSLGHSFNWTDKFFKAVSEDIEGRVQGTRCIHHVIFQSNIWRTMPFSQGLFCHSVTFCQNYKKKQKCVIFFVPLCMYSHSSILYHINLYLLHCLNREIQASN